jgi:hypothetical protein
VRGVSNKKKMKRSQSVLLGIGYEMVNLEEQPDSSQSH